MSQVCSLCVTFGHIFKALEEQDRATNISSAITAGFVLGALAHSENKCTSGLCVDHVKSIRAAVQDVGDDALRTKLLQALNLGLTVVK